MSDESRLDRLRRHASDLEGRLAAESAGAAFAALSGRYVEALRQIEELESRAPAARSTADELAERRRSRRKPINKERRSETS